MSVCEKNGGQCIGKRQVCSGGLRRSKLDCPGSKKCCVSRGNLNVGK